MSELILELDNKAQESIKELMVHYNIKGRAELVTKALAALRIAFIVDKTDGELFARKGSHETKIIIR